MAEYRFVWGFLLFLTLTVTLIGFIPIETEETIFLDNGEKVTNAQELNIFEKIGLFYKVAFFGFDTELLPTWLASIIVFPTSMVMLYLMILIGKDLIPFT